jgi:hypothetical protein
MAKMKKHPSKRGISAASVRGPKNPESVEEKVRERFRQSSSNQQYKHD